MSSVPETRYARNGDINLAYQIFGSGDRKIVVVPPAINHIELDWEEPAVARFLNRLGSMGEVLNWDKRGQGLSDRIEGVPTLEERVDDLRAVLATIGWDQFVLAGTSEGGLLSIMFAALYPERVTHLTLFGTAARFAWDEDYTHGVPLELTDALFEAWGAAWGTPETPSVAMFVASRAGDEAFLRWMNRYERGCSTPRAFVRAMKLNMGLDVRHVVPSVRAPTLLMHRKDDPLISVHHGRWLARHLPNVTYIELDGADHAPHWAPDASRILDETEAFLTGTVATDEVDRVLRTVLFTDLVGSTEKAISLGDRAWRDTLDRFDELTTRVVSQQRGAVVNHTGDGHLATFDGPARAIRCAQDLGAAAQNQLGLSVRAGLHAGEVELRGDNVSGVAVHLAARVAAKANSGQVLVSRTVTDLVAGSGLVFQDEGAHELKGIPGEWQLYSLVS